MKLEQIAEVLRFQERREPAYEGEEPGGDEVCGEAKPENFDNLTGFLLPEGMGTVGLFQPPKKYAIRK